MSRQKVIFLHRQGLVSAGSKIMRCDQLCDMATRYLGDRYEFAVVSQRPVRNAQMLRDTCAALRDAIVIMLKGTPKLFGPEGLTALRKHVRAIGVDYVDTNMELKYSPLVDVHISPSIAGMKILRRLLREKGSDVPDAIAAHLTHHADPRLEGLALIPQDRVRAVYLGNPKNTALPEAAGPQVEVLRYPSDKEIAQAFEALRAFNLHYAVRPDEQSSKRNLQTTKPFTKGFVAAAVGANVMASRSSDDVVNYLGEDYPFLVGETSEAEVLRVLDEARALYGTKAWDRATDRMRYVRDVTSPASVARELDMILSRFT